MTLAVDLLNPSAEHEKKQHKLKRLVQSPNSFFMDVKCPGCFAITTVFSHAQTVVICGSCASVLCQPTGGKARLTEGCSFRKKNWDAASTIGSDSFGLPIGTANAQSHHNRSTELICQVSLLHCVHPILMPDCILLFTWSVLTRVTALWRYLIEKRSVFMRKNWISSITFAALYFATHVRWWLVFKAMRHQIGKLMTSVEEI